MKHENLYVTGYGIFLMSYGHFCDFLKNHKIRSKKLNNYLDKNKNILDNLLETGSLLPITPLNSGPYTVRFKGLIEPFDDDWKFIAGFQDFNLLVSQDGILIGSLDCLDDWGQEDFSTKDLFEYETLDGDTLANAFRVQFDPGHYKVVMKGYKRIRNAGDEDEYGLWFELTEVDSSQFAKYDNPLEHDYDFDET